MESPFASDVFNVLDVKGAKRNLDVSEKAYVGALWTPLRGAVPRFGATANSDDEQNVARAQILLDINAILVQTSKRKFASTQTHQSPRGRDTEMLRDPCRNVSSWRLFYGSSRKHHQFTIVDGPNPGKTAMGRGGERCSAPLEPNVPSHRKYLNT